jgi:hypothetical protein
MLRFTTETTEDDERRKKNSEEKDPEGISIHAKNSFSNPSIPFVISVVSVVRSYLVSYQLQL